MKAVPRQHYRLFHAPGTGSEIVLNALRVAGAPHQIVPVDYERVAAGNEPSLKKVNPLSRVPALRLPSGAILTESGAMVLHLAAAFPKARLTPAASAAEYPVFLRLLFTLCGEIYPCFTFGDDPSEWVREVKARPGYLIRVNRHREELWRYLETLLARRGPWALGDEFSAIDLYLATMTSWRPGRDWFDSQTPRIAKIASRAQRHLTTFA